MVASVAVPNVYLLVLSVAAARYLGAAGLGRQSLIAFSAAAATTLAGAGGFVALMRAVAMALGDDDRQRARALVRVAGRAHLVTGTMAGLAVSAPAWWGSEPRAGWLLGGLVTLLATLQMVPTAVLVGAQRWRDANGVGLLTGALAVPATVLVLERGGGIEGLFAVEAVVVAVNLVWTGALCRWALEGAGTDVGSGGAPDLQLAEHARFAAISTAGVAVTVLVWRRSELVLLAWFSNDVEIARYSVAFAVSALLLTLSERFAATMTPAFTRLVHAGDGEGLAVARARGVRLLLLLSLPFVAGAAGAGPGAIRMLYGDTFARSGTVLLILLLALAALPVWSVSAAVLAAHRDAVSPLIAGGVGAALNVGLALWLVQQHGAVGAAAASAGGQLAAIVLMHHLVRRRVGAMTWDLASLARSAAVGAGTGAAAWLASLWLGGVIGVILSLVAGATALAVLATWTRPLPLADVTWLSASLGGRIGERATALLTRVAR
jgi:O-antigen/teichoic acid export membrane protein